MFTGCTVPNLSFTEKVIVYYTDEEEDELVVVEITDANDIEDIVSALTENTESGSGNCIFTELELVFEGKNESLSLHPSTDGCPTVFYRKNGDHYYFMSNENRKVLYDILAKYEIPLDYEYLYKCLKTRE